MVGDGGRAGEFGTVVEREMAATLSGSLFPKLLETPSPLRLLYFSFFCSVNMVNYIDRYLNVIAFLR